MKTKSRHAIVIGQPIPAHHLAKLINKINARNTLVANVDKTWPSDTAGITLVDHAAAGFTIQHPAFAAIDAFFAKGGKGKGGGQGKGGSTKPKWPDPAVVLAEVQAMFHGKPVANNEGNLIVGEMNAEFGNKSKADYFEDVYKFLYDLFHLINLEEVDNEFVDAVAKFLGYKGFCCTPNSRGQAVGFLVHPRLNVINGPISYDAFKNVQNIPDLRPAFRIDVEDTVTKKKSIRIVVHPKSMLGGPKVTAAVRYQQFDTLVKDLDAEIKKHTNGDADAIPIMVAGDFNFRLNKGFNDADPLVNAGFKLVAPKDSRQTQVFSADSRIDGFYVLGSFDETKYYDVHAFFKRKKLGRAFTDHAMTEVQETFVSQGNTSVNDPQAEASDDAA